MASDNPETYNPFEGGYPGDNYDCGDTYGSEFPAEDECVTHSSSQPGEEK